MDASNIVNFSALKSTEQIDAVIAELNNYKTRMISEAMTEDCREEVDRQINSFLHFCEERYTTAYLFIPNDAMIRRQGIGLNGLMGYYFPLDTDLITKTVIDKEGDVVCMVSVDA